nr:MAG TPA: hypothetical protein [Caudoviricetes sp.]
MEPLDCLPAGDIPTTVLLIDFCHRFDLIIHGQCSSGQLIGLSLDGNFVIHVVLSLDSRICILCGGSSNAPKVYGNSGVFASISAAIGINDDGNGALLSLTSQQREINIGYNDLLAYSMSDIQAKAVVLESVANVAVAGDGKGALCASLGGGQSRSDILLVLGNGVHLWVQASNAHLHNGIVLLRGGLLSNPDCQHPIIVGSKASKFIIRSISGH